MLCFFSIIVLLLRSTQFDCKSNLLNVRAHKNWPKDLENDCGISYADRIIGGTNASLGQYPWLARIGYQKQDGVKYDCGGVVISQLYVLTAAHCVTNLQPNVVLCNEIIHKILKATGLGNTAQPITIKGLCFGFRKKMAPALTPKSVVLGEHNALTKIDCENEVCAAPLQLFQPAEVILPANYNNPPFKHDIALIKLNRKVQISEWVLPICIPFGDVLYVNITGQMAEVAGWGLTDSDDKEGTPYLQTVKLPIVDMGECRRQYGSSINLTEEQLCVGGVIGKDSCAGDSGGPLVKPMNSQLGPRYYLLGVVSFGSKRCGESKTPGIYTNIRPYILWLLNNLKH